VKLLFDQNLSRKLVASLADVFPESTHVVFEHLDAVDDTIVWEFAKANGYTIVSKDSDFRQLSFLYGPPPKTIWRRIGNAPTATVAAVLRSGVSDISAFMDDHDGALLVLSSS
jgi:predicted nuclease of predicted toxin-antitoxin system